MEREALSGDGAEKRAHYRIVYPAMVQPRLDLVGMELPGKVLDVSEAGIRFLPGDGRRPSVGDSVTGRIRFHQRRQLDIQGEVVRVGADGVGVDLVAPGIPLTIIFAEQRHLARLYPDGYDPRMWAERDARARALAEERGRIKIGELEARFRAQQEMEAMRTTPAPAMPYHPPMPPDPMAAPRTPGIPPMPMRPSGARREIEAEQVAWIMHGLGQYVQPAASAGAPPVVSGPVHTPPTAPTRAPASPLPAAAHLVSDVRDQWSPSPHVLRARATIGDLDEPHRTSDELAAARRDAEARIAAGHREQLRLRLMAFNRR
jgi:hypothetical protein